MTEIAQVSERFGPASSFIRDLTTIVRDARVSYLRDLPLHSESDTRQFLSEMLHEHVVWTARVDQVLAGFIAFRDGYVIHMYIAPAYQRRGLGPRLLQVAKDA